MNIKIEQSEFVEIEGLTEAAIASSDAQLFAIYEYLNRASDYLPEEAWADDPKAGHPLLQMLSAVMEELSRRRGDAFDIENAMGELEDAFQMYPKVRLWAQA